MIRVCGWCRYDLTGVPANRCPECGKAIIDDEARATAARLIRDVRDGRTPIAELFEAWPKETADWTVLRAAHEIRDELAEMRGLTLNRGLPHFEPVRGWLDRWAVFLRSGSKLAPRENAPRRGVRWGTRLSGAVVAYAGAVVLGSVVWMLAAPARYQWHAIVIAVVLGTGYLAMNLVQSLLQTGRLSRAIDRPELSRASYPFRSRAELEAARARVEEVGW